MLEGRTDAGRIGVSGAPDQTNAFRIDPLTRSGDIESDRLCGDRRGQSVAVRSSQRRKAIGKQPVIGPTREVEQVYSSTGTQWDLETSGCYCRHRMYVALLGRFVSRDPIGYKGSPRNLFQYVLSSPANLTDPIGYCARPKCSSKNCKWRGVLSGWWLAYLLGGGDATWWIVGYDSTGCAYYSEGDSVETIAGIFGVGYWSANGSFTNLPGPCQWPVNNGERLQLAVAQAGGEAGYGLVYLQSQLGCWKWGNWFGAGGVNIGIAGGLVGKSRVRERRINPAPGYDPP